MVNHARPIILILFIYGVLYYLFYIVRLKGMSAYFIPPVFWIAIFLLSIPNVRRGPGHSGSLLVTVMMLIFFRIAIENLLGVFEGFGYSPYKPTLINKLIIIYYGLSKVLAYETSRAMLIIGFNGKRRPWLLTLGVPLFYTLLDINPRRVMFLTGGLKAIEYLNSGFVPVLANNILLTQLTYIGGFEYSLLYSGSYSLYIRLVPILPNLSWAMKGFLGAAIPLVGVALILTLPSVTIFSGIKSKEKISFKPLLIVAPIVIMLLFISGVFGYRPLIIASGSMRPSLEIGDIVLIAKTERLNVGDVIAFATEGGVVVHRIINTIPGGLFITKGDANRNIDPWILEQRYVLGKVILVIPKLGWLIIYAKVFIFDYYGLLITFLGATFIASLRLKKLRRLRP